MPPGDDDPYLAFLKDLRDQLGSGGTRAIALRVNQSKTWVNDRLNGRRVIDDDSLKTLLRASSDEELATWRERLDTALSTRLPDVDPEVAPDLASTEPAAVDGRRQRWPAVAAICVLAGVATVAVLVLFDDHQPNEPPDMRDYRGATLTPSSSTARMTATVIDTGGQGLYLKEEPRLASTRKGFLPEGSLVSVACQDPHGDAVEDVIDGQPRKLTAWDKLSTGFWVSDLYLSTPKPWDNDASEALPTC